MDYGDLDNSIKMCFTFLGFIILYIGFTFHFFNYQVKATTMLGKRGNFKKKSTNNKYKKNKKVAIAYNAGAPAATRGFGNLNSKSGTNEKKYIDNTISTYLDTKIGGTNYDLTLVGASASGTDYDKRIGRKTLIKSFYIRYMVSQNPDFTTAVGSTVGDEGGVAPSMLRMILFVDEQSNGTAPLTTDVLNSTNALSHLNPNNRERFKILMDKEVCMDGYGWKIYDINSGTNTVYWAPNSGALPSKCGKKYKKLNITTVYNGGTTATPGSIQTGALWLLTVMNRGGYTHDQGNMYPPSGQDDTSILWQAQVRCRFDDS